MAYNLSSVETLSTRACDCVVVLLLFSFPLFPSDLLYNPRLMCVEPAARARTCTQGWHCCYNQIVEFLSACAMRMCKVATLRGVAMAPSSPCFFSGRPRDARAGLALVCVLTLHVLDSRMPREAVPGARAGDAAALPHAGGRPGPLLVPGPRPRPQAGRRGPAARLQAPHRRGNRPPPSLSPCPLPALVCVCIDVALLSSPTPSALLLRFF